MNQEKILKTLLAPIVSEKTSLLSAQNQYAFKVRVDSNKKEIKAAIESLFGVTVENVTTSVVKGKKKVFKGKIGRRVNWKKAMVKVSEGQMIDVTAS
ncbi:LSU ribosomal protein L23p (L23Ae) [Bathymodiolus thermophilus thioautotrophic gill symbiont]|jgi:large subunit ribosomal protein L23|uniref:Large ribosomal subunit protein uL23 n=3 Tax=sulfur-oxidizing symbionts TaxID=32036 RepID=A0A1H6M3Y4_9GAMM|nr:MULTISPECIES: 50S ribosomal protein L23 [Gammaproteobacteria]CAC9588096.1 LSU ribosomal protein L23p (L23Ae) [uncultured Gammaproteobacteria bacterium]CAB5505131.1 LSU ribosomal protein L23p (L23Ae) [Bathymodiolus azoricus thioautotrophic gill symbiont]CAB5507705.1 LSU ribosomal protein L23p (L23Ae) [Bathymodiolus thermophilus thioautotrophic gill symbiont]CAC9978757.1 LSU ribosomal protein L23p (L23Ae) [uncultured Gammaproteobacteria bacterium]SEH72668.1 50S ribosomal protein L23 [Bathymod